MIDTNKIIKDFPILKVKVRSKPLIYLDSAATSQKPVQVISAISKYYKEYNSNVHRSVYTISAQATKAYEDTRLQVQKFINAKSPSEIIFTKGTTESINLVAYCFLSNLKKGDLIITTELEHHSNFVPWQAQAKKHNLKIDYIRLNPDGTIKDSSLYSLLAKKPKFIAISHVSNSLGTINNIKDITKKAHMVGAKVLVDGAQAVTHLKVDVQDLDCDFYAFSGHKILSQTGVGILYAKKEILDNMQPFLYGGHMIKEVSLKDTTYADNPHKYEAGTQDISGVISLSFALDYINKIGIQNIRQHDIKLTKYALENLSKIKGLKIYGPKDPNKTTGIISFNYKDVHPHDVASILDTFGVAVRSGHHCTQPLMTHLKVPATCRISFYIYNTKKDIDTLIQALKKVQEVFK